MCRAAKSVSEMTMVRGVLYRGLYNHHQVFNNSALSDRKKIP